MLYRDFASQDDIDNEYAMSRIIGDTEPLFAAAKAQSEQARKDLDCTLGLRYGPTLAETVDIFPAADRNAPILIFIHGGYWRAFSAADFSYVAKGPVARGITVVMVDYALCPQVTLPEITRQCRAAIAWVKTTSTQFNGDRDRMIVAGHSAGGHLAARALCTDWENFYGLPSDTLQGAYALSGLYDLRPLRYSFVQPLLQLTGEVIEHESPLFNLPAVAPPLITDVGALESSEFRRQSFDFTQAWTDAGLTGSYSEQDGKHHLSVLDDFMNPDSELMERVIGLYRT